MKHDRLSILRAQEAARLEQEKADASYVKAVGRSTRFRDDPYYAAAVVGFEARQTAKTPEIIAPYAIGAGNRNVALGRAINTCAQEIDRIQKEMVAPKVEEPKYWVRVKDYGTQGTYQVGDVRESEPMFGLGHRWLPCDKDGWITHDPQPDSTCPVPAGVGFEAKLRSGQITDLIDAAVWQLGCPGDRTPNMFDIVAWRPVKS